MKVYVTKEEARVYRSEVCKNDYEANLMFDFGRRCAKAGNLDNGKVELVWPEDQFIQELQEYISEQRKTKGDQDRVPGHQADADAAPQRPLSGGRHGGVDRHDAADPDCDDP